jgi:hypothetical protein
LRSTTIQTFRQWVPESDCRITFGSPIEGVYRKDLADGTSIEAVFWFFPLDDEGSLSNLLSLEMTAVWINEASELSYEVVMNIFDRTGRYPPDTLGEHTWSGIIMDSNPPTVKHWIYERFIAKPAKGWKIYRQPPALLVEYNREHPNDMQHARFLPNPDAENVEHLSKGYDYYLDIAESHRDDPEHIKRVVLGEFTMGLTGQAIYSQFKQSEHIADELTADRSAILLVGMDFGLNPAVAITQFADGRWRVLQELCEEDCSLLEFVEDVFAPVMRSEYPGFKHMIFGDPSGTNRSGFDKAQYITTMAQHGFTIQPALTNNIQKRIEAVRWFLRRSGSFLIDKRCEMLIAGFLGGYQWKTKRGAHGGRQITYLPNKEGEPGRYTHPHDALQYVALALRYGTETRADLSSSMFNDGLDRYTADPLGGPSQVNQQRRKFLYV